MKFKHLMVLAMVALLGLAGCGGKDASQAVLDNIFARRSVRSFSDKDVTPEQVETLLKAAMAAPSGMNLQPWRFVVVRDSLVKKRLCRNANEFIATAPVVIAVCAAIDIKVGDRTNQNWSADCAAATENLLLAAQAMGLGACWTAVYPYAERSHEVWKVLNLPESIHPYCLIPVGYPNGDEQPKDKWNPQNIQYDRWPGSKEKKGRGGRLDGQERPTPPPFPGKQEAGVTKQ